MKNVNMGLKVKLLPEGDQIRVLELNIGNSRFIWNHLLACYNETYSLFKSQNCLLRPNMSTFNTMLNMLKQEYPFLREGESTSQQQVFRDLIKAFKKFFKEGAGYPRFKSKNHHNQSFRIQKNGNNIHVTNRCMRLAKLGYIHYTTSSKYRKLLKTSKIHNVTIKRENGEYYAIVNIETEIEELEKTGQTLGIDLGLTTTATLSNGQKITNFDCQKEDERIKFYQQKLARQQKGSKNYNKTLKKLQKTINKKNNKQKDEYHKISKQIVENYDAITMETLSIKNMLKLHNWAPKLQRISLYKLLNMIKYKAKWYGKQFLQVDRFYPSSQICNVCGFKHGKMSLNIREWTCPKCKTHHDRDLNAALNLKNEGKKLLKEKE